MPKIKFTKMVASGNDFVIIDNREPRTENRTWLGLARKICDRKYGVGADGLLILEKSRLADIKMRVLNADGSEAEMCGNGARCATLYMSQQSTVHSPQKKINIETKAGIIDSEIRDDRVRIRLTDPRNIRLDIPIKVNKRNLRVNFIDTGVPHAVIFVEGLDEMRISELGRAIRNHKEFVPRGTNADFVEALGDNFIGVRTYERGVEDETLACGTGSAASALIYALKAGAANTIKVRTQSGETLKVYFERIGDGFTNVWLEGKAKVVYTGVFNV